MDSGGGVPGGVPGGVAGGSMGGVTGGVVGGINATFREPKLVVSRVDPTYPPLARQTHRQGMVIIDAVPDKQGNVVEAKVSSGPPHLFQSVLEGVRRWKYEPTYLNDEPVSVQLNVMVTFRLYQ